MDNIIAFADRKVYREYASLSTGNSGERELKRWLDRAFEALKQNAFHGIQYPRRLVPKMLCCITMDEKMTPLGIF